MACALEECDVRLVDRPVSRTAQRAAGERVVVTEDGCRLDVIQALRARCGDAYRAPAVGDLPALLADRELLLVLSLTTTS